MTIDAGISLKSYDEIAKQLLWVAGKLADLYALLGNEAYADAADSTIGFPEAGTLPGSHGPSRIPRWTI